MVNWGYPVGYPRGTQKRVSGSSIQTGVPTGVPSGVPKNVFQEGASKRRYPAGCPKVCSKEHSLWAAVKREVQKKRFSKEVQKEHPKFPCEKSKRAIIEEEQN